MDPTNFPTSLIEQAAALLRAGRLVAFPTETVYGLGANALDPDAVARIYSAKQRPRTSPLIVHVDCVARARSLALHWPDMAEALAARFWPGPLTLVVAKDPCIPDIVTAGLPTVGLRHPAHPVAEALIRAADLPVAAPSANPFSGLSPTAADHVVQGLGDLVDLVLDAGPARVGIESTVLALTPRPALLRPGMVTREQIEEAIGPVEAPLESGNGPHPSPGLHARHYSPRTPLFLVEHGDLPRHGRGAYLWIAQPLDAASAREMPPDPEAYGATLYATLHELDSGGFDWIAVEMPPAWPDWEAIRDRLRRAAG